MRQGWRLDKRASAREFSNFFVGIICVNDQSTYLMIDGRETFLEYLLTGLIYFPELPVKCR